MGASPTHLSTASLIHNLITGSVTPQLHCVYDDFVETVSTLLRYETTLFCIGLRPCRIALVAQSLEICLQQRQQEYMVIVA